MDDSTYPVDSDTVKAICRAQVILFGVASQLIISSTPSQSPWWVWEIQRSAQSCLDALNMDKAKMWSGIEIRDKKEFDSSLEELDVLAQDVLSGSYEDVNYE